MASTCKPVNTGEAHLRVASSLFLSIMTSTPGPLLGRDSFSGILFIFALPMAVSSICPPFGWHFYALSGGNLARLRLHPLLPVNTTVATLVLGLPVRMSSQCMWVQNLHCNAERCTCDNELLQWVILFLIPSTKQLAVAAGQICTDTLEDCFSSVVRKSVPACCAGPCAQP